MSLVNINIGLLGHVDSGKTSLAKALSEIKSTAAFDKSTQSQERGITLDLGFSAMIMEAPSHIKSSSIDKLQLTFVDCPGHASLIRTIIGGSQIIDFVLLVIDVVKGIQTQTGECIVLAEITCPSRLVVVLNKIDQLEESKKESHLKKITQKIRTVLDKTKFKDSKIMPVSTLTREGLDDLVETFKSELTIPIRRQNDFFLLAVDHCFQIKGKGTVCTGTVLSGTTKVNDQVEIPMLRTTKKIRSIQMFGKPVESASQGDRVGICLNQFTDTMERGLLATPNIVKTLFAVTIPLHRIKYFKKDKIRSHAKFHISVGHETVMGQILLFQRDQKSTEDIEHSYIDELPDINDTSNQSENEPVFALIEFEKAILAIQNSLVIGSKLDMDLHANSCRLAFYGNIEQFSENKNYQKDFLPQLKIFKLKHKEGIIHRVVNPNEVIVTNMFKKQSDRQIYIGLKVNLTTGEEGTITGTFGQTNKLYVQFTAALLNETIDKINAKTVKVVLCYKKFMFDKDNKMRQ